VLLQLLCNFFQWMEQTASGGTVEKLVEKLVKTVFA
jgi:hypothetical protein